MISFRVLGTLIIFLTISTNTYGSNKDVKIKLPAPVFKKEKGFKTLLEERFSCRQFKDKILSLEDVASILWATCGKKHDSVTGATRTIPSAGATYPLELYIVVGENCVDKLKGGLYHYLIEEHTLEFIMEGDRRNQLSSACLGQDFIRQAPMSLIITANFKRTTGRYGTRGERYVYMEVGHASQNTYLAITNLGLSTVEVGAFTDDKVKEVLGISKDYTPLIIMPIGYPARL